MSTENISIGQTFKNLKDFFQALGMELPQGGKERIRKIEDVARHIKWEKGKGRQIVIVEIYSTPIVKEDKRTKGNNNKYAQHALPLIFSFLIKRSVTKGLDKIIFANELFREMGIVNDDYLHTKSSQKNYAKNSGHKMNLSDLKYFVDRTSAKNYRVLESALNNMKSSLISWEKRHEIQEKGSRGEWETVSKEEEKVIRDLKKDVLEAMEESNEYQVRIHGRLEEYHAKVKAEIRKEFGWADIRNGYLIQFHSSIVKSPKESLLEKAELTQHQRTLNDLIIEFTNSKAQEFYNKKKKAFKNSGSAWGEPSKMDKMDNRKALKAIRNFVERQTLLAELFIRLPQKKK